MTRPEEEEPWLEPQRRAPRRLGEVLAQEVASRPGWARRIAEAQVHVRWPEIAGPQLAAHVVPVRLHGGVLVLRADSSVWAAQVRHLAGDIVTRVNAALGDGSVTTLTVSSTASGDGGTAARQRRR